MFRLALRKPLNCVTRNVSTLRKNPVSGNKGFLSAKSVDTGRRFMGGHGPDISKMEAFIYILVGGGGFAAFGMYQAKAMRDRIEAFETGKMIPFKSLNDEDFAVFRAKFRELYMEEEEEEEGASEEEPEQSQSLAEEDPEPEQDDDLAPVRRIAKSDKDTVIFVEAPKE